MPGPGEFPSETQLEALLASVAQKYRDTGAAEDFPDIEALLRTAVMGAISRVVEQPGGVGIATLNRVLILADTLPSGELRVRFAELHATHTEFPKETP